MKKENRDEYVRRMLTTGSPPLPCWNFTIAASPIGDSFYIGIISISGAVFLDVLFGFLYLYIHLLFGLAISI